MFELTDKIAAVTGGGSGIGEAIALLFARQGAQVAVVDVDEEAARRTADRITSAGGQARALRADVTDRASVHAAFVTIAVDYMKKNVRCNCICPARVHTPFVDGYLAVNYPGREQEVFDQLSAYQPLGRMGTPEEVAQLALYLCSDEAAFITGQAFPIDGGVLVT